MVAIPHNTPGKAASRPSLGPATKTVSVCNESKSNMLASFSWQALWKQASEYVKSKFRFRSSQDAISFWMSFCFHLLLLLIFALIGLGLPEKSRAILLSFGNGDPSAELGLAEFEIDSGFRSNSEMNEPTSDASASDNVTTDWKPINVTSMDVQPKISSVQDPALSAVAIGLTSSKSKSNSEKHSDAISAFSGGSMAGRTAENRGRLALGNGGSKESEAAVEAGLRWLVAHQGYDGSWSTEMTGRPCDGKCSHGTEEVGSPKRIAATGLSLLCFLGAGYTHKDGKYQEQVSNGLQFLLKKMQRSTPSVRDGRETGRFLGNADRYEMYEHGIAMLALCEALEMTHDTTLLEPCRKGIEFMIECQHADGSWGYVPKTSGDLSIVGWQMMALKAAHRSKLKVPVEVLRKADQFIDSQQSEYGAYYGYRSTKRDPCATAIGLLIRMYRGWSRTNSQLNKGIEYIIELGPSLDGIYYNYYAMQLLFQAKPERWPEWNQTCRDYLVQEQSSQGHEAGSWYFGRSHFNRVGGRLYCTTMSILTLEVYYRFMPIYGPIESDDFQL